MGNGGNTLKISLRIAYESELETFKSDLQNAFKVAVEEEFGDKLDEPIPSDEDIEHSILAPGAIISPSVIIAKSCRDNSLYSICQSSE
jgi:hypothetical protein